MNLSSLAAAFDRKEPPTQTNPNGQVQSASRLGSAQSDSRPETPFVERAFADMLPKHMPGFEARPTQVALATKIRAAFEAQTHFRGEAGTGSGKSHASLIPAIDYARKTGKPAIISTGTHILQEQYTKIDIPLLQRALEGAPIKVALAKGRGNYLCLKRYQKSFGNKLGLNPDLDRIQQWVDSTDTGDRGDIPFDIGAQWLDMCADDSCTRAKCPLYDQCFYYKARLATEEATLIVCNHALLLANIMVRKATFGNFELLPEAACVVVDEAHHLESIARSALGLSVGEGRFPRLVSEIDKRVKDTGKALDGCDNAHSTLFDTLKSMQMPEDSALPKTALASAGKEFMDELTGLAAALREARDRVFSEEETYEIENLVSRTLGYRGDLVTLLDEEGDRSHIDWYEVNTYGRATMHSTPVDVSSTLRDELFELQPVACLSATMTANNSFKFFARGAGMPDAKEFIAKSPFDFQKQSLLYVPRDRFDPKTPSFDGDIAPRITELINASRGRALVLFTSIKSMEYMFGSIRGRLKYPCLIQSQDTRQNVLRQFKEQTSSVLFAVRSFWEGVDVPGESLSLVVITKLPFQVPTDPVVRAKVREIENRGGNPFMEFYVPDAVIAVRQAFGRLIRTKSDMGVVAILDSRVSTTRYGHLFLNSLPDAKFVRDMSKVESFFDDSEGEW